jgi:hypothetical protein
MGKLANYYNSVLANSTAPTPQNYWTDWTAQATQPYNYKLVNNPFEMQAPTTVATPNVTATPTMPTSDNTNINAIMGQYYKDKIGGVFGIPVDDPTQAYNLTNNNGTLNDINKMQNDLNAAGEKSGLEKYGGLASGIGSMMGGLAGLYAAYENSQYHKRQEDLQNRMLASENANKSAFARAAGGTYIPA